MIRTAAVGLLTIGNGGLAIPEAEMGRHETGAATRADLRLVARQAGGMEAPLKVTFSRVNGPPAVVCRLHAYRPVPTRCGVRRFGLIPH